jgi:hypothetical protein
MGPVETQDPKVSWKVRMRKAIWLKIVETRSQQSCPFVESEIGISNYARAVQVRKQA